MTTVTNEQWCRVRAQQILDKTRRPKTDEHWVAFSKGLTEVANYIQHIEGMLAGAVQHSLMRDQMDELVTKDGKAN